MNKDSLVHIGDITKFDSMGMSNTLQGDSSVVDTSVVENITTFIQSKSIVIDPVIRNVNIETDFITYILFGLLAVIALIWHFMPDRFSLIFSFKTNNEFSRHGDSSDVVPGTLITGFFWLNFFISTGLFLYILGKTYFASLISSFSIELIALYIFIFLIVILVYRVFIIFGTALVFKTDKLRHQQMIVGRNIQIMSGVILTPMLLLIIYIDNELIIILTLVLMVFLQVIRVIRIFGIGKSSSMFSLLHIILYLCALELIPVLVLIRLIANASAMG